MIDSLAAKRRLILSGFAGAILTGALVICFAGFSTISPEPTLGIVDFLSGSVILLTRMARVPPPEEDRVFPLARF